MSLEWTGIERRRAKRKTVDQMVLLSLPGDAIVARCQLLNLTVLGAGIRLEDAPIFSTEFQLSFGNFQTPFNCRLVWRHDTLAGLEFVY